MWALINADPVEERQAQNTEGPKVEWQQVIEKAKAKVSDCHRFTETSCSSLIPHM